MIYIVQIGDGGLVKVGCTRHSLERRMCELQYETRCRGKKISLLRTFEGTFAEETTLRLQLGLFHTSGMDWFRPDPALLRIVDRLAYLDVHPTATFRDRDHISMFLDAHGIPPRQRRPECPHSNTCEVLKIVHTRSPDQRFQAGQRLYCTDQLFRRHVNDIVDRAIVDMEANYTSDELIILAKYLRSKRSKARWNPHKYSTLL